MRGISTKLKITGDECYNFDKKLKNVLTKQIKNELREKESFKVNISLKATFKQGATFIDDNGEEGEVERKRVNFAMPAVEVLITNINRIVEDALNDFNKRVDEFSEGGSYWMLETIKNLQLTSYEIKKQGVFLYSNTRKI